MAQKWPHEYIVRKDIDNDIFVEIVNHIWKYGYEGRFYAKKIVYLTRTGCCRRIKEVGKIV
jgi:hypothetical protein